MLLIGGHEARFGLCEAYNTHHTPLLLQVYSAHPYYGASAQRLGVRNYILYLLLLLMKQFGQLDEKCLQTIIIGESYRVCHWQMEILKVKP